MLVGEGGDLRQWVTQSTCWALLRALSFWPTASAARPPMPMSISSKTSVRGVADFFFGLAAPSSTLTFRASMTRLISPPEAISCSGLSGSPGLVAMRYSTRPSRRRSTADSFSLNVGVTATSNLHLHGER
jgi:hypothetical protein